MAEEQLLNIHTNDYESYFILSTEVSIDNERLQLEEKLHGSNNRVLVLHCPHLDFSITQQNLMETVSKACTLHSVYNVVRMKCASCPLFEVEFRTERSFENFVGATENGSLKCSLQESLSQYMKLDKSLCMYAGQPSVSVKLFLLTPNFVSKDPLLKQVTWENHKECIQSFKRSKHFDFGALFRSYHDIKLREPPDMRTLMNELKEVDRWISLGLNLMIPDYELQKIQATCNFDYNRIMIEIIRAWLKGGNASWIALVAALQDSGFVSLANRIANEHGVPCLSPMHNVPRKPQADSVDCGLPGTTDQEVWISTTNMVKKEREQRILSEKLLGLQENLQSVSDKLCTITSQKEQLYQTLQKKNKQRKFLMEQTYQPDELKELIEEIDSTILKLNAQLDDLEQELIRFTQKELQLKKDLESREQEMERMKKSIVDLKHNNTVLLHHLHLERERKEMEIRQSIAQAESNNSLQKELRQQISHLEDELKNRSIEVGELRHELKQIAGGTTDQLKDQVLFLMSQLSKQQPSPMSSTGSVFSPPPPFSKINSTPSPLEVPHIPQPAFPPYTTSQAPLQEGTYVPTEFSRSRMYSEGAIRRTSSVPPVRRKSFLDSDKCRWFYRDISEKIAERILTTRHSHRVGTYLVFESNTTIVYDTTLSILGKDQVYHFPIYHTDHDLCYIAENRKFCSLEKLLQHYRLRREVLPCPLNEPCLVRLESLQLLDYRKLSSSEAVEERSYSTIHNATLDSRLFVRVKKNRSDYGVSDYEFFSEALILRDLKHNSIHHMLGITRDGYHREMNCIISEPVTSNLKEFLLSKASSRGVSIGPSTLIKLSNQIAHGLAWLASLKCIHRRIAAKNIVISNGRDAKISDFSEACYTPTGMFKCKPGTNVLLQWSAPELLFDSICSSKSDVWSFGVTLWEIFTYGKVPYEEFDSSTIREIIRHHYNLPRPEDCPSQLYKVMAKCWLANPDDRPSFPSLAETLSFLQDGQRRSMFL